MSGGRHGLNCSLLAGSWIGKHSYRLCLGSKTLQPPRLYCISHRWPCFLRVRLCLLHGWALPCGGHRHPSRGRNGQGGSARSRAYIFGNPGIPNCRRGNLDNESSGIAKTNLEFVYSQGTIPRPLAVPRPIKTGAISLTKINKLTTQSLTPKPQIFVRLADLEGGTCSRPSLVYRGGTGLGRIRGENIR